MVGVGVGERCVTTPPGVWCPLLRWEVGTNPPFWDPLPTSEAPGDSRFLLLDLFSSARASSHILEARTPPSCPQV